jgi:molybdopterin synthase catalytic subunit
MGIDVAIVDGPLPPPQPLLLEGAGALIVFEGIVRDLENGEAIAGLEYSTYEPMAQQMLHRIAAGIAERRGVLAMRIEHSRGLVPVGQVSFRLTVGSPHRKEAIAAMDEFIDTMKRDVPIWKAPRAHAATL